MPFFSLLFVSAEQIFSYAMESISAQNCLIAALVAKWLNHSPLTSKVVVRFSVGATECDLNPVLV
jgi:hypothetical protein